MSTINGLHHHLEVTMSELKQGQKITYQGKTAYILGFNNDHTITINCEGAVIRVKREEIE